MSGISRCMKNNLELVAPAPKLTLLMIGLAALAGINSGITETKAPLPSPTAAAAQQAALGPRIQFAETTFDFGKVTSGDVVKHEFVFTNVGTATLQIRDVLPGCDCTTAGTWDRRVEPGKTGVVPLEFNSFGFSGAVAKSATVSCNDSRQPTPLLEIKGIVWKAFDVTPEV